MINTNNHHAIIKNHIGKNELGNSEISMVRFVYSEMICSGKYTSRK